MIIFTLILLGLMDFILLYGLFMAMLEGAFSRMIPLTALLLAYGLGTVMVFLEGFK